MTLGTSRCLQNGYFDRGTQTEPSPLLDPRQVTLRNACKCVCTCQGSAPPVALLPLVKELDTECQHLITSDRSQLGSHPPRFARVSNRVVSLPERADEERAEIFQHRVVSMPGTLPRVFFSDAFDDCGFDMPPTNSNIGNELYTGDPLYEGNVGRQHTWNSGGLHDSGDTNDGNGSSHTLSGPYPSSQEGQDSMSSQISRFLIFVWTRLGHVGLVPTEAHSGLTWSIVTAVCKMSIVSSCACVILVQVPSNSRQGCRGNSHRT